MKFVKFSIKHLYFVSSYILILTLGMLFFNKLQYTIIERIDKNSHVSFFAFILILILAIVLIIFFLLFLITKCTFGLLELNVIWTYYLTQNSIINCYGITA